MERATSAGKGILIEGLTKRYGKGDTAVDALKGVDMRVDGCLPAPQRRDGAGQGIQLVGA